LLIIGGSDVYSGAPALAGLAALRTGCGLAVVAAPASVAATVRSYSPNLIVHALSGNVVTIRDVDKLSELLSSSNAVVLGPGIGRSEETKGAVTSIVEAAGKARKPVLIDADAIRALAERKIVLRNAKVVITPHAGEFKAISGVDPPHERRQRIALCARFALEYSCVLLLKGHNTIVTDGHRTKINPTGNPCLAVGGTGDVLSGIIGTYLAQGADRFQAAVAGAYVHGAAGDLVRRRVGFHMVASDLIEALPTVLRRYDHALQN
jgi:NAD(P)H-hydrate epimerase